MIFLISPATTVTASESENLEAEGIFSISRLVIAGSIEDREPVGMVNSFSASTEQVYCFLEAADIKENTSVSFVWYYGEEEKAKVTLPLGKSSRWRTYSSKKLGGLRGNWKVVLQDSNSAALQSVEFTVE
jgi:hypothetical protein